MPNHKIIPMTDDARFHGGVNIGDMQKISGYYDISGPYLAHYSLCRQVLLSYLHTLVWQKNAGYQYSCKHRYRSRHTPCHDYAPWPRIMTGNRYHMYRRHHQM